MFRGLVEQDQSGLPKPSAKALKWLGVILATESALVLLTGKGGYEDIAMFDIGAITAYAGHVVENN